jgi:hypothetical protein
MEEENKTEVQEDQIATICLNIISNHDRASYLGTLLDGGVCPPHVLNTFLQKHRLKSKLVDNFTFGLIYFLNVDNIHHI